MARPAPGVWSRARWGAAPSCAAAPPDDEAGLVDLSMNLPPPPQGVSLAALLKETTAAILDRTDVATLMAYHAGPGRPARRAAGAAWLAPALGEVGPERIVVCPGAQSALTAVLTTIAKPGDRIVVEPLTYPGLIALAARLGLRLVACPVDDEGFLPEALARLCAEERPAAVYLVPTTRNPGRHDHGPGATAGDRRHRRRRRRLADRGRPLQPAVRQPPARPRRAGARARLPYRHPVQDPVARPAHRLPGRAVRADGRTDRRRPARHEP
jgi:hypothetical protein